MKPVPTVVHCRASSRDIMETMAAAAAGAVTEAAMAPATAAIMAEGAAVAVAAGTERSTHLANGIWCHSCAELFLFFCLVISAHIFTQ
jgi:hypothetical protein